MDLIAIAAATAVFSPLAAWAWPVEAVRLPFGLALLLFLPGYSLQGALLPRRHDLNGMGRLALSISLSLAATFANGTPPPAAQIQAPGSPYPDQHLLTP